MGFNLRTLQESQAASGYPSSSPFGFDGDADFGIFKPVRVVHSALQGLGSGSGAGGASEVVALKTKRHYETLLVTGKPLLVDFMAPW